MQDITDAAGVSKALAVYYFKTKENLLLASIRWVLGRVAERMTGVVDSVEAPHEKVRAMIDAIFVDPRRNRDFYLAYTGLIGEAARNERFNELNVTFRSIMNAAYADLIRSGEERCSSSTMSRRRRWACARSSTEFFLQWLEESDWAAVHGRYKTMCVRAILRYLGATTGICGRPRTKPVSARVDLDVEVDGRRLEAVELRRSRRAPARPAARRARVGQRLAEFPDAPRATSRRVIAFSRFGHGRSDRRPSPARRPFSTRKRSTSSRRSFANSTPASRFSSGTATAPRSRSSTRE